MFLLVDLIDPSSISENISLKIFIGFMFLNGLSSSGVSIHSKFIGFVIQYLFSMDKYESFIKKLFDIISALICNLSGF